MNFNLIVLKEAAFDLQKSISWYELRSKGLGKRYQKQVFETLKKIENNPLLYPIKFSGTFRFAKVDVFPFFIVYEIINKDVVINFIFHTSRNPSSL